MNASSTVFQNSAVVRLSIIIFGFLFLRILRNFILENSYSLDTNTKMKYRDCLSVDEWPWFISAHFSPCKYFFGFVSRSDSANFPIIVFYIGSNFTILGLEPRSVSKKMFSFLGKQGWFVLYPPLSTWRGGSGVGLSQKALISRRIFSFAGCAML